MTESAPAARPAPDSPSTPRLRCGLGEAEASARLKSEGLNELPRPEHRSPLGIVLEVLREPMLALLLVGGAIYLLLGDFREALILVVFAALSVVITVVQEARTERVLEALRDLTSPRALVIRDGERRRIAGRDVVRGDLVLLGEGDRVPADAVLLESQDLMVDESLLTGESVPVRKTAAETMPPPAGARPGGNDLPYVYSGTLVVRGSGIGEVTATGPRSEIGRIGQSLHVLEDEPPRLRAQTQQLVKISAVGAAIVSTLAVVLYGVFRGGWLDAVLAGITLGIAMLPEEFPVVLAVFMAMGAWRISRARVLTRRAAAIEALGSATVLCTDKTGTLTENRMSIAELRLPSGEALRPAPSAGAALESPYDELVRFGVLASAREPFDPMDRAFHDLARGHSRKGVGVPDGLELERVYPLSPGLLAVTQAWRDRQGRMEIAAKGAPEAIARLCRLGEEEYDAIGRVVDAMAAEGLRVLGVARASHPTSGLPDSPNGFDFVFLGLVGLADPLRASVPAAVAECRSAGIRVVMITGDYPATARAIAREAGIDGDHVLTGRDLETLDDAALADRLKGVDVFARIMPEQKLRLVEALKEAGDIVAMTGDGVNDAPSLKAAHIGVAMGGRGTDVAREASDIVLLDDDFSSIVKAVRLGRRIYDNLRKAMGFIVAVHAPIAGMALLPLLFGLPLVFRPIHIAFLEMIIDPVCALAFEAETEETDVMRRPPRRPSESLFTWPLVAWSVLQGAVTLALVAAIYLFALQRGLPEAETRALTFFALVFSVFGLILVNRSFSASMLTAFRRPNPWLLWIALIVLAILAISLFVPAIRSFFRFGPLHGDDLALSIAAGVFVLGALEGGKRLLRAWLRF